MYIYICMCMYVYIYIFVCVCIYIFVCVCMYVYIYLYVYVCMYAIYNIWSICLHIMSISVDVHFSSTYPYCLLLLYLQTIPVLLDSCALGSSFHGLQRRGAGPIVSEGMMTPSTRMYDCFLHAMPAPRWVSPALFVRASVYHLCEDNLISFHPVSFCVLLVYGSRMVYLSSFLS